MAADYIPGADGEFDAWQANFVTYATANAAALGLDPLVDIPPVATAQTTWSTDYGANTAAQAAAQAARQAKEAARSAFEGVVRPLVGRLQASADVDDTERAVCPGDVVGCHVFLLRSPEMKAPPRLARARCSI